MTVLKGFLIVILSGIAFATVGATIGYTLGTAMPGYYRAVYPSGKEAWFDPVAVGLGQGLTQGLVGGLAIGSVIVLAVAWHSSPRRAPEVDMRVPRAAAPVDAILGTQGITTRPR